MLVTKTKNRQKVRFTVLLCAPTLCKISLHFPFLKVNFWNDGANRCLLPQFVRGNVPCPPPPPWATSMPFIVEFVRNTCNRVKDQSSVMGVSVRILQFQVIGCLIDLEKIDCSRSKYHRGLPYFWITIRPMPKIAHSIDKHSPRKFNRRSCM